MSQAEIQLYGPAVVWELPAWRVLSDLASIPVVWDSSSIYLAIKRVAVVF